MGSVRFFRAARHATGKENRQVRRRTISLASFSLAFLSLVAALPFFLPM